MKNTGQLLLHTARVISDIITRLINTTGGSKIRYLPRLIMIPTLLKCNELQFSCIKKRELQETHKRVYIKIRIEIRPPFRKPVIVLCHVVKWPYHDGMLSLITTFRLLQETPALPEIICIPSKKQKSKRLINWLDLSIVKDINVIWSESVKRGVFLLLNFLRY